MDSLLPDRQKYWEGVLSELTSGNPSLRFAAVTDSDYPQLLARAYDSPPFIFINGTIMPSDVTAVAIVGSRSANSTALDFAQKVAGRCADGGITVVSGLAKGVDTAAHEAALLSGGRTIAVIAGGIDRAIYPPANSALANRIISSGCIISQFRPGTPATSSSFVARNAVISGLAPLSLIVDASERSGTRSEAEQAVKQGRQVLLWAPLLATQKWAKWFAIQPGVILIDGVSQVLDYARDAFEEWVQ